MGFLFINVKGYVQCSFVLETIENTWMLRIRFQDLESFWNFFRKLKCFEDFQLVLFVDQYLTPNILEHFLSFDSGFYARRERVTKTINLLGIISPLSSSIQVAILPAGCWMCNVGPSRSHAPVGTRHHSPPPVLHKFINCFWIFTVIAAFVAL